MSWSDPLAYPGTDNAVLVNKFGERDADALRTIEYAAANARLLEVLDKPIPGQYDLDHLKAFHQHLLQDVYEWAGRTREEVYRDVGIVNFGKGGTSFVSQDEIASTSKYLFDHLSRENHLKGLDRETFVSRLTQYYVGLNKIHPFREGNGRATQAFLGQLANEAGYQIDYSRVSKERWNEAARLSARNDTSQMRAVFSDLVSPIATLKRTQDGQFQGVADRAKDTLSKAAELPPLVAAKQQKQYQPQQPSTPTAQNKKGYSR
ncbi:TPA: Fic/DOC family protein [Burkholderia cepacia]